MRNFMLILTAVALSASTAQAQNLAPNTSSTARTQDHLNLTAGPHDNEINKPTAPRVFNNEVKLNLPSLALGNISLQYERAITPHFSGALGLRMGPERSLPFSGALEKVVGNDSVSKQLISGSQLSNYAITPEIRYYFGKRNISGFYVGLFGRFGKYSLTMPYTVNDASFSNGQQKVLFNGGYSYGGVGLQLGTKFNISNRVSLDWFFLGPMFTGGTLSLEALTDLSNMSASSKAETTRELREVFDEVTVENDGVRVKKSLPLPGIRTGLSIGFRF